MRSAGLVAAILLAGCNQIFGLNQTSVFDAAVIPPDGAPGCVLLTFALEDTAMNGGSEAVTFPLLSAPIIQVAAGDEALVPAKYSDPMKCTVPGSIPVPLFGGDGQGHVDPYRFVYQLDGTSLPHEVQWNLQAGHIIVPVFGHPDRVPPPGGSGYDFKPVGMPTGVPPKIVVAFTTGIWTTAHGSTGTGEFSYVYPTSSTTLDGGALGTPTVARGDSEYLVEVDGDPACSTETPNCVGTFATAFATMQVDLTGGAPTLGAPVWKPSAPPTSFMLPQSFSSDGRIRDALGNDLAPSLASEADTFLGGEIPSTVMPAFTIPGVNGGLDTTMLAQLAFYTANAPPNAAIRWVDPFPPGTTADAFVLSRQVARLGGALPSGLQAVFTPTNLIIGDYDIPAAMPTNAMIGGVPLATDGVAIDATGSAFLALTFMPEAGKSDDDYLVTLLDVGTGTTAVRTFQVLLPSVRLPTDILMNGHTYAVQIVGRNGFPGAQAGDYTVPRPPHAIFSTGTLIPGTFVITK